MEKKTAHPKDIKEIPYLFAEDSGFFNSLKHKKPVFFLDYDGTLSPIVSQPEDALLSPSMRQLLQELSKLTTLAIVTGRDKADIQNLVQIPELIYAGSHGFEISGPEGLFMEFPCSEIILPKLDIIEKELKNTLSKETQGTRLDRKKYAIGIHYRNARNEDEERVKELATEMVQKYTGFKTGAGKKIIEIKPSVNWHKGKAVLWILEALNLSDNTGIHPIFIGDDITDEDAFKALKNKGTAIMVGTHDEPTYADFKLHNVDEVALLFQKTITYLKNH